MIVSHEHEFIFIHIQRTAGTSIEKSICKKLEIKHWQSFVGEPRQVALDKNTQYTDVYFNDRRRRMEGEKHITASEMRNLVGEEIWSSYFTFSFVRNPWSKLLSSYLKRRKELPHYLRRLWPRNKLLFNLAILYKLGIIGSRTKSQFDYISNESGNIIVDFVGKFENLHSDFNLVCSKIGIEPDLTNNNDSTSHRSYRSLYYAATKDLVKRHEIELVNTFGYTF